MLNVEETSFFEKFKAKEDHKKKQISNKKISRGLPPIIQQELL